MSLLRMLVNRCTIERWTPRTVADDYTLSESNFASVATQQPCNLQERAGRTTSTPHGEEVSFDAVLYVLPECDLRPRAQDPKKGDRIVMTLPDTGAIYYVRAVLDQTGREKFKKAFLSRE